MLSACLQWLMATLVPIACPCGEEGIQLCSQCADELACEPLRVEDQCPALNVWRPHEDATLGEGDIEALFPVYALGAYGDRLRAIVLDFKNGGHFALAPYVASALEPALDCIAGACAHPHVLVAAPSTYRSVSRRGERHIELLVRELSRLGAGAVAPRLTLRGGSQHSKGRRERTHSGRSVECVNQSEWSVLRGAHAVIVDDVATTGSTLANISRCLDRMGVNTCAAVTIASAQIGSRVPELLET